MSGPAPAEPVAGPYSGRRVALLTQHGKERVIAPVLDAALGCRVERVNGFDTDLIGTFTRDIPRTGTQVEAARRKARIGMELSGLPLAWRARARSGRTRWRDCSPGTSSFWFSSTTSAASK
jgi:hypothetical protein